MDGARPSDYDPLVALWRCPHCATPQRPAARCWVCGRGIPSCATCRFFRTGVTTRWGYCARRPTHLPVRGGDVRLCWEPAPALLSVAVDPVGGGDDLASPRPAGLGLLAPAEG
jgi:hypothetical protein